MEKLRSFIQTLSNGRWIFLWLAALMIFNILMNVPGLPTSTPSMQKIAPAFVPFDLQWQGYTAETMKNDLVPLGDSGRAIYRNFMLLDIFFPAIYGIFFASLIFRVTGEKKNLSRLLFMIPLLTAILDYFENGFLFLATVDYPQISPTMALAASLATQCKMIFNIALIVSLVITLSIWITGLLKK